MGMMTPIAMLPESRHICRDSFTTNARARRN